MKWRGRVVGLRGRAAGAGPVSGVGEERHRVGVGSHRAGRVAMVAGLSGCHHDALEIKE